MIELYYAGTPNGMKVAIMLEEVGLPYNINIIDIFEGDQLTPGFRKINPNNKIPAIIDTAPTDGGSALPIFESGAILQYLAEKTGMLLPTSPRERSIAIQWLTWQMSSLGPMTGQASHFVRYAPPGNEYGIVRYTKELQRLLRVLEARLTEVSYVGGDEYTIADIAIWPGRTTNLIEGCKLQDFPVTRRWFERLKERPAIQRVLGAEQLKAPAKYMGQKQVLSETEWSNMFGDAQHTAGTVKVV